jgi:hypothetical protein
MAGQLAGAARLRLGGFVAQDFALRNPGALKGRLFQREDTNLTRISQKSSPFGEKNGRLTPNIV